MRHILAQERAELERDKQRKQELEQEDEAIARALDREQRLQSMADVDTNQPAPSPTAGIDAEVSAPALATDSLTCSMPPSAPPPPTPPVDLVSSSQAATVLPDHIPVVISSSPGSSQHFLCYPISPADPAIVSSSPRIPPGDVFGTPVGSSPSSSGGRRDDIREYQAQVLAMTQQEAADERYARLLQEEYARDQEAMNDCNEEADAQLAAEAWAAEQALAEEARQRELQVPPHHTLPPFPAQLYSQSA